MIRHGYYALRICGKRIKRCRVRLSVRLSVCPSGSARYSSKAVLRQAKRVVTDTAVQQSINISCRPRQQQQTWSSGFPGGVA